MLATRVEQFVAVRESFADDLAHARDALDGLRRAELAGERRRDSCTRRSSSTPGS